MPSLAPAVLAGSTFQVVGARVVPSLRLSRRRPGEVTLARGEAVRLDVDRERCLRLAPAAEYALVFYDTRVLERAKSGDSEDWRRGQIAVEVLDLTQGAGASVRIPRRGPSNWESAWSAPAAVSGAAKPDLCPREKVIRNRAEPWTEGETFALCWNVGAYEGNARVFDIIGPLVFAIVEEDEGHLSDAAEELFAQAGAKVNAELDLLDRIFDVPGIRTSDDVPQFLVLAHYDGEYPFDPLGAAFGFHVRINLGYGDPGFGEDGLLWLLSHEVGHVYQDRFVEEHWAAATHQRGHGRGSGSLRSSMDVRP